MGEVWLARVQRKGGFERFFALKVVLSHLAEDDKFREMFLDEARIASLVAHPNVASIVDTGEEAGTLYLAMEWVDGDSLQLLHRVLRKSEQSIPLGILLRVIADACAGLHAVHEVRDRSGKLLDVVHRDTSPQNILVSTQGSAKLIDFGVAKAHDRIGATTGGDLKGKARYMAPEQASGQEVDRRADIWAVGAVLYFLLEGKAPFDAENDIAVLKLLLEGKAPRRPTADAPSRVIDIVMRCLSPDRANRYATAAQLQNAIEQAMRDTHLLTSVSDVAAFVGSKLREHAIARKARIEATLLEIERGGLSETPAPLTAQGGTSPGTAQSRAKAAPTSLGLGPAAPRATNAGTPPSTPDLSMAAEDKALPGTLSSASLHASRPAKAQGRSKAVYAMGAGFILMAGYVVSQAIRTRDAPTAPPAAAMSTAPATPSAAAPTAAAPTAAAPVLVPSSAPAPAVPPSASSPESATTALAATATPSGSTPAASATRVRTASTATAPPPKPTSNCRIPFYYDESGNKVFKKECF
jgi:serine/threonine protein kinase